ncbi:hypothetical protein OEZ85_003580 [Tetradesmus obliquus]|uniref:SKP1 component POZ domain-containing protein n=1 Tax=Tetradesmus obliquus TaxID=3088 RepID=A0ABY8UE29_TETOB|nr:hypothetical protein OEZ85_003580 [Tetradesmus obliquus]
MDVDEQQLNIRLANESDVLKVDAALMRACSSVARGLPAEAAEWDLSNLLIEGQPVQRSTVIRWLNYCYEDALMQLSFALLAPQQTPQLQGQQQQQGQEQQQEQQQQQQGQEQQQQQQRPQQQQPQQQQQQQQQQERVLVPLHAASCMIGPRNVAEGATTCCCRVDNKILCTLTAKDAFAAEVAAQTEQLLYIVYKLQLQELLQLVKDVIAAATESANGSWPQPLLSSSLLLEVVYSPRVLGVAGYSEAAARAAFVRSQLQQPLLHGP